MSTEKKFKTIKEAEDELKKLENKLLKKMCPVFRTNCKGQDCCGYVQGRVFNVKAVKNGITSLDYGYRQSFCSSPLVTGEIECLNDC